MTAVQVGSDISILPDSANDQKKTVNRDKIARELLAERDKQKEQKQKLRDEKGSQLKNKFGKDNS